MKRFNLTLNSQLKDLPLHNSAVDISNLGQSVDQLFEQNPLLPGVVLLQDDEFVSVVSRRRFLELISRAYGREIYLRRPLSVLYDSIPQTVLTLTETTLITTAAEQAIARPADLLYEPIVIEHHTRQGHQFSLLDMHDVLQAQARIHQLTAELLQEKTRSEAMQTEKMAILGRMMAGVADEIRNPVNFIWGNLQYVSDYADDLVALVQTYEQDVPNPSAAICDLHEDIDTAFVLKDFGRVINSIEIGTERLRILITSLHIFSRVDEIRPHPTDLNWSLDSTLAILNNRLKDGITVQRNYDELPEIPCHSSQISQALMNIVGNAIDALVKHQDAAIRWLPFEMYSHQHHPQELTASAWEPRITLTTQLCDRLPDDVPTPTPSAQQWVSIRIQDNGPGIPAAIQPRIFDDFFTTKRPGEGTGLGLPIARQIIVDQHHGHLIMRSLDSSPDTQEPSQGTEFEILLPVDLQHQTSDAIRTRPHAITDNVVNSRDLALLAHF